MNSVAALPARADNLCDGSFTRKLDALQRFADSIRIDKPGLARVYAPDGTEFTAGQALWIQGQLREIRAACGRAGRADAAQRLDGVDQLVRARTRQNL